MSSLSDESQATTSPDGMRQYIRPWSAMTALGDSVVSVSGIFLSVFFHNFSRDRGSREDGGVLPVDLVGHQMRCLRTKGWQRAHPPQRIIVLFERRAFVAAGWPPGKALDGH